MKLEDKTMQALAQVLNLRQKRQEIISSNIANSETPNYKAKRLDFEAALGRALDVDGNLSMKSDNQKHFDVGSGGLHNLQPEIYDDPNGVVTDDGNTVDREKEMARMAENKIMYDAAVQLLQKKIGLLKYTLQNER